jgi:hypothetical protein
LMRVIYCLSHVLSCYFSCYLGLGRRLQHWVTSRMLRVTPRTRRLMPPRRKSYMPKPRVRGKAPRVEEGPRRACDVPDV